MLVSQCIDVCLRSSMPLLHKPTSRIHFADRVFQCTGPSVWNSLNSYIVDSGSLAVLKSRLKAFLFCQTFAPSCSARLLLSVSATEVQHTIIIIIIIECECADIRSEMCI